MAWERFAAPCPRPAADAALAAQRLERLESEALLRAGIGFSEGLEEAVDHLGQTVAALALTDPATGLMNSAELGRRLAVEVERCRRTEVGLGAFVTAIVMGDGARRAARAELDEFVRCSARLIATGLRRYDVVGRARRSRVRHRSARTSAGTACKSSSSGCAAASPASARRTTGSRFALRRPTSTSSTWVRPTSWSMLGAGIAEARGGAETVVWV